MVPPPPAADDDAGHRHPSRRLPSRRWTRSHHLVPARHTPLSAAGLRRTGLRGLRSRGGTHARRSGRAADERSPSAEPVVLGGHGSHVSRPTAALYSAVVEPRPRIGTTARNGVLA